MFDLNDKEQNKVSFFFKLKHNYDLGVFNLTVIEI